MVLEKASTGSGDFERLNFLSSSDVKSAGGKFICTGAPRVVDTKFGEKVFVDVKPAEGGFENGDEQKTWVMNNKSRNHCIDELGSVEEDWISQPVSLEVVVSLVNGEKKDVIYAVGSI